ncbi:hypothetical protein [Pseudomonas sp. W03]|uniref:hypothetical protein n=1 Tax=Pseudomonas sp. W03 TaxID=3090666 RepID=UPI003A4DFAD3
MPEVNVIKPFAYQEPGAKARVVEVGKQPLSEACAAHARSIGALEKEPEPAAVAPATEGISAEEPAAEVAHEERSAKPRK